MKNTRRRALPVLLLVCSAAAHAADNTLLFGCSVMSGGAGVEVVFADASAPIPLKDGSTILPSNLVGTRCADLIRLLLDNALIDRDQLAATSHLVINTETKEADPRSASDADVPDCIIWDIDTANLPARLMQLVCDVASDRTIVAQESSASPSFPAAAKNYVGWNCVDALDDLGGLSNVIRSSVIRPRQAPLRQKQTKTLAPRPGSIMFYQMTLAVP